MTFLHNLKINNVVFSAVKMMNKRDDELVHWMAYIMIAAAIVTAIVLQFVHAPYGRYSRRWWTWAYCLPARWAWFLQEQPAFIMTLWALLSGGHQLHGTPNVLLLVCFLIHYFQRTFIFSALIRGGKPTPMISFLLALIFCIYNGYMQSWYLANTAYYPESWLISFNFVIGMLLFIGGMALNIHSDHILRNLRRPGESGYRIPKGGMFTYVSGGNYFGEICEWWGFALAAWNLPATAFAIFTTCNLVPRALTHHQWYHRKFGLDYPPERKAIIPFLL